MKKQFDFYSFAGKLIAILIVLVVVMALLVASFYLGKILASLIVL